MTDGSPLLPYGEHRATDPARPGLHEPVLSLGYTRVGPTARVSVGGEIDMSNAHLLVEFVAFVCDASSRLVLLDLAAVSFLGAHGISALLRARDLVTGAGGNLVICDPSPFVLRVLAATRMMHRLRLDLTLDGSTAPAPVPDGRAVPPDGRTASLPDGRAVPLDGRTAPLPAPTAGPGGPARREDLPRQSGGGSLVAGSG
jgi:anti-anti-sigma factor